MGKPDRIESYTCESCNASFSKEEGERHMAAAMEHLRHVA
jgi:hypothetical protein